MGIQQWGSGVLMAAGLTLLPVGSFVLDPTASEVTFSVADNQGGFVGVAPDVQATAVVREEDGTFVADVDVRIETRTITTHFGLRDNQMHREFLLTDRYPVMTFRGTVVPTGSVATVSFGAVAKGELTIKGTTRAIEFPVRVIALRDSYLVDGKVTIRMTDFAIPVPRFFIFVAEDPVEISMRVRFVAPL